MNYAEQDYNPKYAAAQQAQGHVGLAMKGDAMVRPDGLTSCLERIGSLVNAVAENSNRLRMIADSIGGQEPEKIQGGGLSGESPTPNIPLFMARKIESILQEQIESQRLSMARIDRAIA